MLKSERGVTIIEMVLALAIAGLLAATITFGRDNLRAQQQFSQGVDQMVNAITDVRNQASTTVGRTNAAGGSDSTQVAYAKVMQIGINGTIKVSTETINSNPGQANDETLVVQAGLNSYNVQIPWSVHPILANNLLFGLQSGGMTLAYHSTGVGAGAIPGPFQTKNGSMAPAPVTFQVTDNRGNIAHITVDQSGNASRKYP